MVNEVIEDLKLLEKDIDASMTFDGNHWKLTKLTSWFQLPDGNWELGTILPTSGNEKLISLAEGKLYVHGEKFNQPIFHCNNIAGLVDPVVPDNEHRALYSTHSFKILFKEGGCGTFVPLFFNLISSVRQYNQRASTEAQPRMDPLQAAQTPVDEMMRHAYVDPNDPTRIFLQQPTQESQLRRRTYNPHAVESSI